MKSFEKDGLWWVPGFDKNPVPGKLAFNQSGVTIELYGFLNDGRTDIDILNTNPFSYLIVHGLFVKQQKLVTALKSQVAPGMPTSKLYPSWIIVGKHFDIDEPIKFEDIIVEFDGLEEWVGINTTTVIQNSETRETSLTQKIIDPIEIGTINNHQLQIAELPWISPSGIEIMSILGLPKKEFTLRNRNFLRISTSDTDTLESFEKTIQVFQEFLIFACGQMIVPRHIKAKTIISQVTISPSDMAQIIKSQDNSIKEPRVIQKHTEDKQVLVDIYREQLLSEEVSLYDNRKTLFRLIDIQDQIILMLEHWSALHFEISMIISLYLKFYYLPKFYSQELFLSSTQAIEGFHRIHHESDACDKKTKKSILKEIKSCMKKLLAQNGLNQYEDSFTGRLNYCVEFSLRERIRQILTDISGFIPNKFSNVDIDDQISIDEFAKAVSNQRGNLTHPSKNKNLQITQNDVASVNDKLDSMSADLRYILEACLLKALGLSKDKTYSIMSKRMR